MKTILKPKISQFLAQNAQKQYFWDKLVKPCSKLIVKYVILNYFDEKSKYESLFLRKCLHKNSTEIGHKIGHHLWSLGQIWHQIRIPVCDLANIWFSDGLYHTAQYTYHTEKIYTNGLEHISFNFSDFVGFKKFIPHNFCLIILCIFFQIIKENNTYNFNNKF